MKITRFIFLISLLVLTPKSWGQECGTEGAAFDPFFNMFIEYFSRVSCFKNKTITKDHEDLCGCMKSLTKSNNLKNPDGTVIKLPDGIAEFNKRIKISLEKSEIVQQTLQTKNNGGAFIISVKQVAFIKEKISATKDEELKKKNDARKECGFTLDEYYRQAMIPPQELINNRRTQDFVGGEDHVYWMKYLRRNPELFSVNAFLSESDQLSFKSAILKRLEDLKGNSKDSKSLYGDEDLWKQIDSDFKSGDVRKIITTFTEKGLSKRKNCVKSANAIIDDLDRGSRITTDDLLGNSSLWDAFFVQKDKSLMNCSFDKASMPNKGLECLGTLNIFCALSGRDNSTNATERKSKKAHDFNPLPLIEVQEVKTNSERDYEKQADLFCRSSPLKLNGVLDKSGNVSNKAFDLKTFKEKLCNNEISIDPNHKPLIPEADVKKACNLDTRDNPRLLGFYQKLISDEDFDKSTSLVKEDLKKNSIEIREYLKSKSKFDMPTAAVEETVQQINKAGSKKEARRIISQHVAEEKNYSERVRAYDAEVARSSASFQALAPKSSAAIVTPVDQKTLPAINAPVINPVYPPSIPLSPSEKAQQQQIVDEESKKIKRTKADITELESKKTELPPSNSSESSRFEKQIQELKDQLASSESRYQKAIETLKKDPQIAKNDPEKLPLPSSAHQYNSGPTQLNNLNTNDFNSSGVSSGFNNSAQRNVSNVGPAVLTGTGNSSALASGTNKALLQANGGQPSFDDAISGNSHTSLILSTVKNEKNEVLGVIADPKVYQQWKSKDKTLLYDRFIKEMVSKNLQTLIIQNGEAILKLKLVGSDPNNYSLEEEISVISANERKYFAIDLKNTINSNIVPTE